MFSLEKLKVYDKALASAARLAQYAHCWDKRHAVTDQLLRASESVPPNLAEGARLRSAAKRQHLLEDIAESAVVRVGTYLQLCARTDKLALEHKACAMDLMDRIASMLRGLGAG